MSLLLLLLLASTHTHTQRENERVCWYGSILRATGWERWMPSKDMRGENNVSGIRERGFARPAHAPASASQFSRDSRRFFRRFFPILCHFKKKKGFFNPSNLPYLPLHSFLRHPLLFLISFLLLAGDVASRDSPETGILAPDSFPAGLQDSWPHLNETNISTLSPPLPKAILDMARRTS